MSAVRTYLEEKAQTPKEWLRREPRTTHPEILALVEECLAGGGFYDDDVERFVNERIGDLPPHQPHMARLIRDPLVEQLGSEVYVAKCCIRDAEARAIEAAFLADGFVRLEDAGVVDGARYEIRLGTLYCGSSIAVYGDARPVRAKITDAGCVVFMPKGAKTRCFVPSGSALIRSVAS